jgi:large subunit ribosomal protein L29
VNARELREKTTEDLRTLRETLRKGLFNLRFRSATDRVENTAEFGRTRRDIARIETILTERRAATKPAPASKTS